MDGRLDYHMDGLLHEYLNQPEDEMTLDDEAFARAYADNVNDAPEEVVREFLEVGDHNQFYKNHSGYYGSIVDAYGVWNAALIYAQGKK